MHEAFFGKKQKMSLVFILFSFFVSIVFCQENQINGNKKLKEEILAVFKTGGEEGLRDFVKTNKDRIENKFIVNIAKSGVKERSQEWIKICEIIAEEKKDEKTLADVYYYIGYYFRLTVDNKRAIEFFEKALAIYVNLKDIHGQGIAYQGKGDIFLRTGDLSNALEMLDKALLFLRKAKDTLSQGNAYKSKGDVYFYTGDNAKSLEMYEKALPFLKKAKSLLGQGNIFKGKGDVYFLTGFNSKSLEMYEKALSFFEQAGNLKNQGNVYNSMGRIYSRTGENASAIEMYKKALSFYEKEGQSLNHGTVYMLIGEIYIRTSDYANALKMCDKALPFFLKLENLINLGSLYMIKGDIYYFSGDYTKALEMFKKSMIHYEKAAFPRGQGGVYLRQGDIYLNTSEEYRALDAYGKALSFFEKTGDLGGEGSVYRKKGIVYFLIGENSRAHEMYDKALQIFKKMGELNGQGNVYYGKGNIYLKAGKYSRALAMFQKAFSLFSEVEDIEYMSHTLHKKAIVLQKQGKKDEALSQFEKGISKLERVRAQAVFMNLKQTFMEKVYEKYEETTAFMLENNHYGRGFKYAESMQARVFLDQLIEGLMILEKGISPDLKEKQDELVSKLSILSKEINNTAGKQDKKKFKELKDQYSKVEGEFEELLIKIRLKNPLYASIQYPEPVSVQDLQDTVLEEGELLLRYFIPKDKIYIFLVSKEDFKVVTLKDTAKDVNEMVEQYLISVEENNPRRMKKYGKELYQKLVKPLEVSIQNREEIIIVPDRELATIPFESFVMDDKKSREPVYLLEKYRVKYIQSASALAILRQYYQRQGIRKHFIGFGDPVYDYKNFKQGKPEKGSFADFSLKGDEISQIHRGRYQRGGGVLNRLQGSGREVHTIAELFKKHTQKCVVHLREQATETNAKLPGIKEFDYIHFSCHGILGDGFQGLVLSQIPGSHEDGYLTLNEIMNCDYHAKLVVLSACRTGKGKMERAEGVSGLTRAVMYAGTPAVVASLWDVDDKATKELMVRFYKYLLEKNSNKEEALRQAKLDLIKSKKYASPVHWSAFVMYGE
jgi:CHAT domain-containing protein/uncharacterized protein HemY